MKLITKLATSLMTIGLLMLGNFVFAADYPAKPIEVIIPYGAGGNTDTSGRIFINALRKALGSEVVPINVTGAGGTIGMAQLAHAKADGYKLGFTPIAPVTVQPHLRNCLTVKNHLNRYVSLPITLQRLRLRRIAPTRQWTI